MRIPNNIILVPLLAITGCGLAVSRFYIKEYDTGKTKEVTVGSVMMAWGSGIKNDVYGNVIDGLRKELSYSGIAQNVLQISYREFSLQREGAYARQPFYQELKYDISSSRTIMFQDIKIQIDSADQQKITYTILQGPSETEYADKGRIGIRVDPDGTIREVYRNTPAYSAALQEGDKILMVDGEPIPNNDLTSLLSKIMGEPGTTVNLIVDRNGKEKSFKVKRKIL